MDAELIKWNGRFVSSPPYPLLANEALPLRDPKLIVDREGRIIAILLGRPEDPEWSDVVKDAFKALARARKRARRHGAWWAEASHRRGRYFALTTGVSFGGGQRRPGNLANTRFARRLILDLLRNKSLRRLAGFQSSGFAMYAPKLYRYYCTILKALFEKHPGLVHIFDNSIFPAVTFNCGPGAVTCDHLDHLNLSHGLCGITCGGDFDHTEGGHIHLDLGEKRVVIEFPSGASMFIPSGFVRHGNTPIRPGETRHSFTQYAAGGLFRWVAYGFQSAKALLAQVGGREAKERFDGAPGSRWRWALDLFSKVDELDADRAEVFGACNV
ncbi:hypothetical protein DFH09DRAFT_964194 [Mycena vulgaris]|nr:hypothetical protein DFH09DRAFT_964194 [Mycena vulgaris]